MRNIFPAAIGEWINSSSEFSSYLVKKKHQQERMDEALFKSLK